MVTAKSPFGSLTRVLPQQPGPWMHSARSHARTAAPRISRGRRMADRQPGRAGGSCNEEEEEEEEGGRVEK